MAWFIPPELAEKDHLLRVLISCCWQPGEPKATNQEVAFASLHASGLGRWTLLPKGWRVVQIPENIVSSWTWNRQELKHNNLSALERRESLPRFQGMETPLLPCYPVRAHLRTGICTRNCNILVLASLHIGDNNIKSQLFLSFLALFWCSTGDSMLLRDPVIFNFSFSPHQANHSVMKWWFHFLIFLFSSQYVFANQFHKPLREEWAEGTLSFLIWNFSLKETRLTQFSEWSVAQVRPPYV